MCSLIYKIGCFCKNGYVRESDVVGSSCIKCEKCKTSNNTVICIENEKYQTCGSACVEICHD